jgi:steroid delta-isomerase-like uncharacterized protein
MSMSNENKAVARRFFSEILSTGDWSKRDEIFDPNVVMHHPSAPEPIRGADAVQGMLSAFRAGIPDLNLTVEQEIAEGDNVVAVWRARGTHSADLFGIPPSNKSVDVQGVSVFRFSGGKIVEDTVLEDTYGMMQQIGVIPT